jgi:hypothetical protein
MIRKLTLVACSVVALSGGMANAGPCNTAAKDAASGPTPGQRIPQLTQ